MQNLLINTLRPADDQECDVEAHLLYATYSQEPLNHTMAVITAIFGGSIVWGIVPAPQLSLWIAAVLGSAALGHVQYQFFKKAVPSGSAIKKWQKIFFVQATTHGAAWSLGPVLLLPHSSGVLPAFFLGILLCVSAVAVSTVAKQFHAMRGFIVANLLPPVVAIWLSGDSKELMLILILLASSMAFIAVGYYSNQSARTIYETQFQLRGILNSSQDAIITIDSRGRVSDWNPRAEQMLGWTRAEALGLVLNDTITPPKNREYFQYGMKRFLALGEGLILNKRIETSALHKNGTEFPVELTFTHHKLGRHFYFTAFITDITERKAIEDRLELFRRVFHASNQCVGICDGKGYLLYQNHALEKMLGYTDAEIIGQHFSFALAEGQEKEITQEVGRCIRNGKNWVGELPHRRKDGSVFITMSNIGFIKNDLGEIQYIFNIWTDFSQEISRRNELALAREAADKANQAKSEFLSSMSHELRTPLNAILGFAQMLGYEAPLTPAQQDHVQEILKGGQHLLELINEVLELAKIEGGHVRLSLEPVNLEDLITECFDLIRPLAAEKKISMQSLIASPVAVRADRVRLKQVVLNLLSNAIKYNYTGGNVQVDAAIEISGNMRLSVTDTGIGIHPDKMSELFQAFNRLGVEQGNTEGTGIGLTITQKLTELMHGKIGVESKLNHGSCFWIELPGDTVPATPIPFVPQLSDEPVCAWGNNAVILYIDDSPVNLKLVRQILGLRSGMQLLTAQTPQAGIELAHQHQPDIVLLDINMPGMDGYAVLHQMKADTHLRCTTFIALTANAMSQDIEKGLNAGFHSYLTKPLEINSLLLTIDRCLAPGNAPAAAQTPES
ncbi:PAS domain S-box protein [Undibacterium sp. FT147W]|uniref:histidine kinase n=1 Tax=Undibacterium rivi TaxID=2828729 RepID=A0ABS5H003_9BURK|nr:PAS domain S-box protein [Undibacterium rivi]MBR7791304.1 PAS domain S-box protein [Undibacterium rivi]